MNKKNSNVGTRIIIPLLVFCVLLFFVDPSPSYAQVPFPTTQSENYLIVANDMMMSTALAGGTGYEIGSNNAPVPATGDGECSPTLLGNIAPLPEGILQLASGRSNDGNIAITDPLGRFSLAGYGVYADLGIRVANPSADAADDGSSGSFFNDPVDDGTGNTFQGFPNSYNDLSGGAELCPPTMGTAANAIFGTTPAGVIPNFPFAPLINELAAARTAIEAEPPSFGTGTTLDVSPSGILSVDTTIELGPGKNIIDIVTGGGVDFKLQDLNLVINGSFNSFVIFRVPDDAIMDIANSNILVGNGGIGLGNVLFFSNKTSDAFKFSNTVLNGIAFWALDLQDSKLDVSNGMQGCTQLIANEVLLSNVRISRCAFKFIDFPVGGSLIPIDMTTVLLAGTQMTAAWMIPVIVSGIGFAIVIARKI